VEGEFVLTDRRPTIALLVAPSTSVAVLYGLYDLLFSAGAVCRDMTMGCLVRRRWISGSFRWTVSPSDVWATSWQRRTLRLRTRVQWMRL